MSSTCDSTAPPPQSTILPASDDTSPNQTSPTTPPLQLLAHKISPPRTPLLRLRLDDLSTPGTTAFLRLHHATTALTHALSTVLTQLYTALPATSIPPTRSVTLVLRAMDGVAYTTGLDLDNDHKEIHFNTSYIAGIAAARQKEEIMGVLVHEMVHCWQYDARGTAPGGLIEGVADWVRLKAGLAPPHWKRRGDGAWDAGYDRTAYFLEWLEGECGPDVVRRLNERLRLEKYDEDAFWEECCGERVGRLWGRYRRSLGCGEGDGDDGKPGHGKEKEGGEEGGKD